jgi:hypothetical protein
MLFWEQNMPMGMLLRSKWEASHLSDPARRLSLDDYKNQKGNGHLSDPISAKDFIEYGRWFHNNAALKADPRKVKKLERGHSGYRLALADGEIVHARRVIVAAGLERFAYRPAEYDHLPPELASHSSQTHDFSHFRGKEVLVIGGGQSGAESAGFLIEAGAKSEMLIRKPRCIRKGKFSWIPGEKWRRMFYGRGDVGPAGISLIVQYPNLYRCFPLKVQRKWDARSHKTGFSVRHIPVQDLPIQWGKTIRSTCIQGDKVRCELNDGSVRLVDHIVLATGYKVNIRLYEFLSRDILQNLNIVDGYPRLDDGLESSIPGLHFVGAPAAWSFGPLVRFVAGTDYLARSLARRVRRAGHVRAADHDQSRPVFARHAAD